MEGRGVDLLFGLDMLKRHQACIDLAQDALIIQGRRIPFLSEHEAPKQHFDSLEADEHGNVQIPKDHPLQSNPKAALGAAAAASAEATATSFPGTGNTLTPGAPASSSEPAAPGPASSHSSQAIDSLMALGVSRQEAIRLLDASGGNPDVAASLMFS
ncbi:uncharacterized protein L969DRAFT_21408 [Mixia osmundae IAM 14324]|nr:uncharacterized protein L969DRAFT_21408 [Mixia osmundae IAM 14324]KEI42540.1 hypothetical protein L969DRAFT_21408 [Mixia osmundae IAM 14324]